MPVFFGQPLGALLAQRQFEAEAEVRAIDPDALQRMPRVELEQALVAKYRYEPPEVDFDARRMTQRRIQIPTTSFTGGPPGSRTGVEIAVHIPCRGATDLLRYRPSSSFTDDYSAETDGKTHLVFKFQLPLEQDPEAMATAVQRQLDERLRTWPQMVDQLRSEVIGFNDRLPGFVGTTVGAFLDEAKRFAALEESIDIPLLEQEDSVSHAVSLAPKRIALPAPRPNEPNPRLDPVAYEALIDRLRVLGVAIERVPQAFAELDEETLRFFFLVVLNSQFGLEGATTGETFNAAGKTDILLRWQNANLFVAECKVWRGESVIDEAIDQLLRYLTVRDSRAALLLFVHGKGFTEIMAKAIERAKAHVEFARTESSPEDEGRLIFRLPQDARKSVAVAVLGVHIYDRGGPRSHGS